MYPLRRGARYSPQVVLGPTSGDRVAQAQAAPPAAIVQFDPGLYPPPGSVPVLMSARIKDALAGVTVFPAGAVRKVDRGYRLVIATAELFANAPVLDTLATWTILADGAPLPGLGGLTMQFRDAGSLSLPLEQLRIIIEQGVTLSVALNNLDGAVRTFGVLLTGWTYKV